MQHIASSVQKIFRPHERRLVLEPDRRLDLRMALRRLPADSVFAGMTAAWLFDLRSSPPSPLEVLVPKEAGVSVRSGLHISRARLLPDEVTEVMGLPCTTALRALLDVSRDHPLEDAVAIADAALNRQLVDAERLSAYAGQAGTYGIRKLRRVVELADGRAESHPETLIRLILIQAGLPCPDLQRDLFDSAGRFLGRADLYYEEARLVIEYDGSYHRDNLHPDLQRQNRILAAGYQMLRFCAPDLRNRAALAAQVADRLPPHTTRLSAHNALWRPTQRG